MRKLLIATRNKGKFAEIAAALLGLPFELLSLDEVPNLESGFEVEETGQTFEENAVLKARGYGQKTDLLTLADDSGLEVDAINGRPGVFSARYGQTEGERIHKVLNELTNVPEAQRTARYRCVLAIYDPKKDAIETYLGTCEGVITKEPKGSSGFGYDPIFFSLEKGKTAAEMSLAEKNEISHRGRALKKVRERLKDLA